MKGHNYFLFCVWTLLLFLTLSFANQDLVCQKGVSGFLGVTIPRGDIFLEHGKTLKIYCQLDSSKTSYNSSYIKFDFSKANVSKDAVKTRILNETTALLEVKGMNVSKVHVSCELDPPNGAPKQICQNEVTVGYPPLPVENFKCLAPGWRSLNCSWNLPANPINTNYELYIVSRKLPYVGIIPCPNSTRTPTSCVWGPRTEPSYRANTNPIYLRLNGTNVLNPRGMTWRFDIDHFTIVVPQPPEDVKFNEISTTSGTVSWTFKYFKDFSPGLFHRIQVCVVNYSTPLCNTTIKKSSKGSDDMQENITLPYAYLNYSISISMRSRSSKDQEEYWSPPSVITVALPPRIPARSPEVAIGSYESVPASKIAKSRDIYLYWKHVDRLYQNGPELHYEFDVWENKDRRLEIFPKVQTLSYAKFQGLNPLKSYHFNIYAVNSIGRSVESSAIEVPAITSAPLPPQVVSKFDFTNGSYEIRWNAPQNSIDIFSYTVFRCWSIKPRPYQCQDLEHWDDVSAQERSKVYHNLVDHKEMIYQFAVSANSHSTSSGMVWASCTHIHDTVPEKLRKVQKKSEGETHIHIQWWLECSYKPGVIDGFKITYCLVDLQQRDHCSDEKSEAVSGASVSSLALKNLKPCSTYLISVSILTSMGESQKSDPIYASTKPSAPSSPPDADVITVSNNSATINIIPRGPLNGIIKQYKVKYKSVNDGEDDGTVIFPVNSTAHKRVDNTTMDTCLEDQPNESHTVKLEKLKANTNYKFTVSVCTVRCSEDSKSLFFKTGFGYTNLKDFPRLQYNGGNLVVNWNLPGKTGGPIENFELLMKRNGEETEILEIEYLNDTTQYEKVLKFSCDSDTNVTAQVRAVSKLESGELVYGNWSLPGNLNCGGGTPWLLWVGVVIGALFILIVIGIFSVRMYHYLKQMKEFDVKLPPGLAVHELNGFSMHTQRSRKSPEGDTRSFNKEESGFQLQTTKISANSKELTSLTESCLNEREGNLSHMGMSFDNEVYMGDLENTGAAVPDSSGCSEIWNVETLNESAKSPTSGSNFQCLPLSLLSRPAANESGDENGEKGGASPCNPLLKTSKTSDEEASTPVYVNTSGSSHADTGELAKGPEEKVANGSCFPRATSSSQACQSTDNSAVNSGSNGTKSNTQATPASNSSSYVRWNQMTAEPFLQGDPDVKITGNETKTPYCQVGILLEN